MSTICGHDREALRWAIAYARDVWANDDTYLRELQAIDWRAKHRVRFDALSAIIDPAKLAAILAERGRELGVIIGDNYDTADLVIKALDPLGASRRDIVWCYSGKLSPEVFDYDLSLPQARAILAAWLELEDGDREGAEKALRGDV
jgi:hypothetical protein